MNKNEVKKDLYKSKAMAKFSHYCKGRLFYEVKILDKTYQFPIDTVEYHPRPDYALRQILSEDLGTTSFYSEMKGSDLNRWINKAIDNEEFIEIIRK